VPESCTASSSSALHDPPWRTSLVPLQWFSFSPGGHGWLDQFRHPSPGLLGAESIYPLWPKYVSRSFWRSTKGGLSVRALFPTLSWLPLLPLERRVRSWTKVESFSSGDSEHSCVLTVVWWNGKSSRRVFLPFINSPRSGFS